MLKAIVVLAPSFILSYYLSIASALDSIAKAFPQIDTASVQLLTSLPSLVAMFIIFLSGYLTSRFTKKQIILTSMTILAVGGLIPIIFHSQFRILMVSALLMGVGYGGIAPLSSALINEHFEESKQASLLGFQSVVIGVGGVCFSYLGGVLSAREWWYTYFAYFLFLPALIGCFFLPKGARDPEVRMFGGGLISSKVMLTALQGFLFSLFYFIFQNNISLLINSSELAGKLLSVQSAIGIVSGLLGGKILNSWGKCAIPYIFVIAGIGTGVVYISRALPVLYFGALLLGFIASLRMPAGYIKSTACASQGCATMAITVFCCANQVGQFLSPVFINVVSEALDLSREQQFLVGGIVLLIIGTISLYTEIRNK